MTTKMGKKQIIQAVVLADDFITSLTPVQDIFPTILMPVINIPVLDYLVETLIKSRVQELFLYCSNHVDLIRAYIKQKKWFKISVSLIVSDTCTSLGDALRDIDTKGSIRGNFILIRGDAFINADLTNLLINHCAKLKEDKGASMTMVLRNIGSMNESFLKHESCLVVSDKSSKKILHYNIIRKDLKKVKLELNWFLDHSEIEINTCFMDTHVYLCSPSVLPLFSDNFDFQTMEDFIRGVLMNEEILNSRIYWQQLNPQDYSLPIVSWNAYHTLNRDILNRHSFPLTPNAIPLLKDFIYMPRSTYKHKNATLAKGCVLEKDSILCQNSILGNNTSVTRSIIGNHCLVGSNVTIKNSYILSDSKIEDNCTIVNSIVFTNCFIKENTQISGCILCPKTIIRTPKEYIDSIIESENDKISIKTISEIDPCNEFQLFKNYNTLENDNYVPINTDTSSIDEDSECNFIADDTSLFLSEVIDSLLRGFQDQLNCENLILEINSSRYAYNVTMNKVTYNVIKAILSLPFHYLSEEKEILTNLDYHKNLKRVVTYFYPIILNYVKTEDAQDDCLHAIEEVASTTQELLPFLQLLLHMLYDRDVLSEEKILEWYESKDKDIDSHEKNKVRAAVQPFIKWLEEAEEDSSDSEND
ncbi:translation initiation factor eIF-2B subunit epsilon [Bombus impatiens]|uniref:Translation initiation factor eIF2B subunit epsilon n=1 Tax=Bombus impatiens TaxID=132113 RepID=A0A6P3V6A4_BOMIM|nr:translation initiation factor eIF-2B subunit epsilon [Bombus impatiens]XP_012249366.1 translation initiation factor eIF-2B subunit epsilon [Bombus impatiens]